MKRVNEFCDLLITNKNKIPWYCESRIDNLNVNVLKKMKQAGCYSIQFGIESGNQKILNKIKKNISLKKAIYIIKQALDLDIKICCSFILGHAYDTIQTMEETINFIFYLKRLGVVETHVSLNTPFPGTYQYDNKDKLGITIKTKKLFNYTLKKPIISTKNFSYIDLQNLFMKYIKQNYEYHENKQSL